MKEKRRRVILLLYLSLQVHCGYFMILRKVTHIWRFMFLMTLVDWRAVLDWPNVVSTLIGMLAVMCCLKLTGMLTIMCCSRCTGMLAVMCCLSTLAIMCCLRLASMLAIMDHQTIDRLDCSLFDMFVICLERTDILTLHLHWSKIFWITCTLIRIVDLDAIKIWQVPFPFMCLRRPDMIAIQHYCDCINNCQICHYILVKEF